jgi:Arc/MetJ family transcription regulator
VRKPASKRGKAQAARAVGTATATVKKRVRKNIIIDVDSLQRAMAALHSTNQSETVNVALDRLAEDAAILAGIDAAIGLAPDFPDLET